MGFLGGMAAGFKGMAGGEITQVTQAIEEGRIKAFDRMIAEAKQHGATGVTGVISELKDFAGNTEFLFVGSCLNGKGIDLTNYQLPTSRAKMKRSVRPCLSLGPDLKRAVAR